MARRVAVVAVCLATMLSGCGGSEQPPQISPARETARAFLNARSAIDGAVDFAASSMQLSDSFAIEPDSSWRPLRLVVELQDGWGQLIQIRVNPTLELRSIGADGRENTADDLVWDIDVERNLVSRPLCYRFLDASGERHPTIRLDTLALRPGVYTGLFGEMTATWSMLFRDSVVFHTALFHARRPPWGSQLTLALPAGDTVVGVQRREREETAVRLVRTGCSQ